MSVCKKCKDVMFLIKNKHYDEKRLPGIYCKNCGKYHGHFGPVGVPQYDA
jgi:hypothetical protein